MKLYTVECISGEAIGPCGIFSTMNLAISEVINHNKLRTDAPTVWNDDGEAEITYEGDDNYNYTEYRIEEVELNRWED